MAQKRVNSRDVDRRTTKAAYCTVVYLNVRCTMPNSIRLPWPFVFQGRAHFRDATVLYIPTRWYSTVVALSVEIATVVLGRFRGRTGKPKTTHTPKREL